ncbi:MAG: hypothetical protein PVI31_14570, partial [Gemmatimonadota bacterium]
ATAGRRARRSPRCVGPARYHHYVFELDALSTTLDLPASTSRDELIAAMGGNVVAKAAYVGRFRREG